jgi:hypothetical protein
LTLLSSYTASKTLVRGYQYINPDSFLADQAPQAFDTPQRLVVSYIYQLPFGRGKHFGSDQNRWVNGAFGGWSVSGITTYMTGFPFTPSMGSNLDNGNSNNPNRICNGRLSSRTINTYYDTSCFTSTLPPNVFGNSGFGVLRGPGYRDWDLGLMKDFPLGRESRYLQFRAEFFNLPNNVNWGAPNSYECGGGCGEGTITSLAPGSIPREIQFGLKLYF